jgi:RNA polymerase sigma factor (sigma-70 family)
VVNQVIDESRKSATEARFQPDRDLAFEDPALDETWDVLSRLPEDQRRVLILRYYADLPLTDIADVTGAPIGTVKSWIHRGLERLREVST